MLFSNMKISGRLGLGFGALLALLLGVAMLGYVSMGAVNDALHTVGRVNYPRVKYAQDLSEAEYQVARDMRTLVIVSDEAIMKGVKENIDKARKNYQEALDALNKLPLSEAGKAILAKVKEARDAALIPNDKVIELGLANKPDEATPVLIQQAFPANKKVQGLLDEFAQLQDKFTDENILKGEDRYKSASFWIFLLVGAAMLLGAVIAILITPQHHPAPGR